MDPRFILALDQGTTSCRAILFNQHGEIQGVSQQEFPQIYPQPGWVEHDANTIWQTQLKVAQDLLKEKNLSAQQIAAIGITNQRETVVLWDRKTGEPVHNAIVWQCRRSTDICKQIKRAGDESTFRYKTGLVVDAYFSGTKIKWLLDEYPELRQRAEAGELMMGTMETWLVYQLSGKKLHITEPSNASRTLLYNITTGDWDDELLKLLTIPRSLLPELRSSSEVYGQTQTEIFGGEIPIAGMAGDQQAALFGQGCFEPGTAKNTYGTGCFVLMNTGDEIARSESGLISTVAWQLDGKLTYALEGSVFIGGAVVQWLRDELQIIKQAAETHQLATEVEDTAGVYLVPAFVGLGAPYWNSDARGMISGLTRGANRKHIVRAALESIAYQSRDVLDAMAADAPTALQILRVDGGAAANDFLMQFQADLIQQAVERPTVIETTALGAAYLAGLAVGYWANLDDIRANWSLQRQFKPQMAAEQAEQHYRGWQQAVRQTMA